MISSLSCFCKVGVKAALFSHRYNSSVTFQYVSIMGTKRLHISNLPMFQIRADKCADRNLWVRSGLWALIHLQCSDQSLLVRRGLWDFIYHQFLQNGLMVSELRAHLSWPKLLYCITDSILATYQAQTSSCHTGYAGVCIYDLDWLINEYKAKRLEYIVLEY